MNETTANHAHDFRSFEEAPPRSRSDTLGTTSFDAVVIGAGPAGAMIAHGLAASGVSTLLVEKCRFPRRKLCGGCLAAPGVAVLERAGLGGLPTLASAPAIDRLEVRAGRHLAGFRIPAYRVVERSALDADLVAAACEAGARFRDGVAARVCPGGQGVSVGEGEILTPRIVVVADGLKGRSLDADARFAWHTKSSSPVGLGMIADTMPSGCGAERITMFQGPQGYLGVAPLADGRADLAAAVSPVWLESNRAGAPLPAFAGSFGIELDVHCRGSPTLGTPHLTRSRNRVEVDGRIFLCGDSIGYLEPFTGEGMSWALASAERILPHLLGALDGTYLQGSWSRDLAADLRARRVMCRGVSALLARPRLTRAFVGLCGRIPPAAELISDLLGMAQNRNTRPATVVA